MGINGGTARAGLRRAVLGLALLALTGCTALYRNHGYVPREDELAAITVGVDTRETVSAAIGTPTAGGVLSQSGYYYVRSQFRQYGPREPQEVSREVLAINFSDAGTVSNISRYGLSDGRVVVLSRRVTTDNVRDNTLIRQLFGNFGRINAGDFLSSGN